MAKGKSNKEVEKKLAIKRTMSGIKKHIDQLEVQQEKYLELAKKAKMKNAKSQYALALSGLKSCMIQKQKAEEMALNIEIACQMKDLTKMTSTFLDTMQMVSKDMIKTTKEMDFSSALKNFESAMNNVEENTEKLDILLDVSNSNYSSMFSKTQSNDIEQMINDEVSANNNSNDLEAQIKSDLMKIDMQLSGKEDN